VTMTAPQHPRRFASSGPVTERVSASVDRTAALRERAASTAAVSTPAPSVPAAPRAQQARLLAAHAVAAAYYQAQMEAPDGDGPRRYLQARGVPTDGTWAVGYAPDRPTGLVNALRRQGFTDVEILATGLASTGRGGQMVDRFRNRVMLGVRDHRRPDPSVVGFVGQAPPGAGPDVPTVLYSPATAVYRPGELVFGLAEQRDRAAAGARTVVATDPLSAVAAATAADVPVVAVAACGPTLTAAQVAALTATVDPAAGVVVTVVGGETGRRAADRAFNLLAPAFTARPQPGPVLAAQPGNLADTRPLLEVVVRARIAWVAGRYATTAGRQAAARAALALLVDAPPATVTRLTRYAAQRLGLDDLAPVPWPVAAAVVGPPEVLAGAATPTGPPPAAEDVAETGPKEPAVASTPSPASAANVEDTDEPLRSTSPTALEDLPAGPVREAAEPEQLLLDFGGAGSDADRGSGPATSRPGPAGGGVPGQAGSAQRGEDARGGGDPAGADPDRPGGAGAGRRPRGTERPAGEHAGVDPTGRGPDASVLAAGRGGGSRRGRRERPDDSVAAAGEFGEHPPSAASDTPASEASEAGAAAPFRPAGQGDLAPAGEVARLRANLAALRVLRTVQAEARPATVDDQAVLARWSGWGAVPGVFEARTNHANHARFAAEREQLRELLSPAEYAAAERTTLNAHYTDARYVQAIWDAMVALGFDGGAVLEPGCGSGNFIGLAPAGTRMVGVELDPTTAGIAAALYPHADIRVESFADTRAPTGAFDATVGNVPFADVALVDRRHNPGRHSIHNHFIIKSLHLTRPGGLVAVLTSRYTMDATNPAARREMAELADLVAAVRLPAGAHQTAAGTKVVTDLLILRRREPDRPLAVTAWEQSRPLDVATDVEQPDPVNEYFLAHPQHVLGEMTLGRGMHRDGELVVRATGDVDAQLTAALADVVAAARAQQQTMTARDDGDLPGPPVAVLAPTDRAEGHIEALADGTFTTVVDGQVVEHPAPKTQAAELRALLGLRDTVTALLDAEAATIDDGDEPGGPPAEGTPAALRAQLNVQYDAYVATFGPLNRFTLRPTGHVDEDTGEPKLARNNPPMGRFCQTDPHAATVFALEIFDDASQTAAKADIFTRRVILPREPRLGADTPEDAMAICLTPTGRCACPRCPGCWAWTRPRPARSWVSWSTRNRAPGSWWRPPSTCPGRSVRSCAPPRPPPATTRGGRPTSGRCRRSSPATAAPARSTWRSGRRSSTPATSRRSCARRCATPGCGSSTWAGRTGGCAATAAVCWPAPPGVPRGCQPRS
jgi:hypothetical protein